MLLGNTHCSTPQRSRRDRGTGISSKVTEEQHIHSIEAACWPNHAPPQPVPHVAQQAAFPGSCGVAVTDLKFLVLLFRYIRGGHQPRNPRRQPRRAGRKIHTAHEGGCRRGAAGSASGDPQTCCACGVPRARVSGRVRASLQGLPQAQDMYLQLGWCILQ